MSEINDSQQDTVKPELAFDFVNTKSESEIETNIAKQVNQIIENGQPIHMIQFDTVKSK